MFFKTISSLALLLLLGCTRLPDSQTIIKDTHIPSNFAHQNVLDSLGSSINEAKDFKESFFVLFPIPELHALINEALENNTNLLTLESKIKQAASNIKINAANILPSISSGANYNYSDRNFKSVQISYNQNALNSSLSLNWEVDLFGRLSSLYKASKQSYLAAKDTLQAAQVSLIADVANYYFAILELESSLQNTQENIHNLEQILEITQQKYHLGLSNINDLSSLQTSLFNTRNTALNLEYQLEQNKNALSVLLNHQSPDYTFHTPLKAMLIPKVNALPQEVLLWRPDVQNSIHNLYATLYTKQAKKLALLPSLNIGGSLGQLLFSSSSSIGLISQITSALTLPLLNRQNITQAYLSSKEDVKQAQYSLQNTINIAIQEVNNASINIKTSNQNSINAQKNLDFVLLNFESMQTQYDQKLIDKLTFLNAKNTLLSAKNTNLSAIKSQNLAIIALYRALAGRLSSHYPKDKE